MDLVTGPWNLSDLATGKVGNKKNGLKVFSCFHCGGGSTMGYKLAGFDVLGGVEIDPEMMKIYRQNHNPKHSFLMGVQDFKSLNHLPEELHDLDILDGSPPCSSFSMSGSREDKWGKENKFREGQTEQVLDDLFFHFIEIADKLRPKVVIAENVKGLIIGNAKGYVIEIFRKFKEAGYDTQLFLLNASHMGVPQARERTFFISRRRDLNLPEIKLEFNEPVIAVEDAIKGRDPNGELLSEAFARWWRKTPPGKAFSYAHFKGSFFNSQKLHPRMPANTTTATKASVQCHWHEPRMLSDHELIVVQSFPDDFDFCGHPVKYVCGMSVPPLMMQRVASEVARQLFNKS